MDFLKAEANARLVLTDSGGVQEESCILGVPCVTLRENTERPETLDVGANMLAGYRHEDILRCARAMMKKDNGMAEPVRRRARGRKDHRYHRKNKEGYRSRLSKMFI